MEIYIFFTSILLFIDSTLTDSFSPSDHIHNLPASMILTFLNARFSLQVCSCWKYFTYTDSTLPFAAVHLSTACHICRLTQKCKVPETSFCNENFSSICRIYKSFFFLTESSLHVVPAFCLIINVSVAEELCTH
jgi:hypothetical protein